MDLIENHFLGCSIVFLISLFMICFTAVVICEVFAKTFKSYLDHKRFLETFLVTQKKEDKANQTGEGANDEVQK